jgi:hypothetical protein
MTNDEGCIPVGEMDVLGLVIHPEAGATNLWGIAESRQQSLVKLLAMLAEGCGAGLSASDFVEVVQPRVQEILTLASTGNERASLKRNADHAIKKSV